MTHSIFLDSLSAAADAIKHFLIILFYERAFS